MPAGSEPPKKTNKDAKTPYGEQAEKDQKNRDSK